MTTTTQGVTMMRNEEKICKDLLRTILESTDSPLCIRGAINPIHGPHSGTIVH